MLDDVTARMVYAGKRWHVTDTPTRLRHSVWTAPREANVGLDGWRFQGTDEAGLSLIFDVYKGEDGWHVHRAYDQLMPMHCRKSCGMESDDIDGPDGIHIRVPTNDDYRTCSQCGGDCEPDPTAGGGGIVDPFEDLR